MSDGSVSTPEFRPAIIEALAAHEGLRKLGFPSEDLYMRPQTIREDIHMIFVMLQAQGMEFTIAVGAFDGTEEEFKQQWLDAIEWWNNESTDEQLDHIWMNSRMFQSGGRTIVEQLRKRGIRPPNLADEGEAN